MRCWRQRRGGTPRDKSDKTNAATAADLELQIILWSQRLFVISVLVRPLRGLRRRGAPSHVCRSRIACVTLSSLEDGSIHSLNEIKRAWPRKTRKIVARCHVPADSCKRTRNLKTILSDPFMSRCKIWELTLHVTKLALAFRREAIFSNEPRKNAAEGGRHEGRGREGRGVGITFSPL